MVSRTLIFVAKNRYSYTSFNHRTYTILPSTPFSLTSTSSNITTTWYICSMALYYHSWLVLWEDSFSLPSSWIVQTPMEDQRGFWTWRKGSAFTSPQYSLKTSWMTSWKTRLSQKWVTQNQPPQWLKTQKNSDTRELLFWSASLKEMLGISEWYSPSALPCSPLTRVSSISYKCFVLFFFKKKNDRLLSYNCNYICNVVVLLW